MAESVAGARRLVDYQSGSGLTPEVIAACAPAVRAVDMSGLTDRPGSLHQLSNHRIDPGDRVRRTLGAGPAAAPQQLREHGKLFGAPQLVGPSLGASEC